LQTARRRLHPARHQYPRHRRADRAGFVVGDIITTAISLWLVREARALGAPWHIWRMLANVAVDGVVGIVPRRKTPSTSCSAPMCGTCGCSARRGSFEHDPEKWIPVFGLDHALSKRASN
jgi:hypothetical protein